MSVFPISSYKSLIFPNEPDFQRFRVTMRVGHPVPAIESVPLLLETERTLKAARKATAARGDASIHPFHLFLGASQLPTSFTNLLASKVLPAAAIEAYYVRTGHLLPLAAADADEGIFNKSWQAVRARLGWLGC
ncbi:hypothetical protein GCM10027422_36240 [Hymenobacter arcticus]